MAEFPEFSKMVSEVAEKALDEYEYKGKTLRQWTEEIVTLSELKNNGRLLILPCNINDRIYTFYDSDIEWCFEIGMSIKEILEEVCEEKRVVGFDVRCDGLCITLNGGIFNPDDRIPAEEFGKTVFMTEQEAQESLERMKGE